VDLWNEIVAFKPDVEGMVSFVKQLLRILERFQQVFDLFQSERFGIICATRCAFKELRGDQATVSRNWESVGAAAVSK
jgi:hypothetical protein